ncbi:hypothetical protein H100_05793 [Trichophyton rubrum MR850]|nr:hypothetical protein H100_05793 [Trichophyton rubrum MR850]
MYTLFFHDNYDYCDNGYIPNTEQSNSQHSACFYRTEGSDASVPHLRVSGPDETLKDIYELVNSKLSYFSCSFLYALLKYSTRILSSTGRFTLPIERNGNEANKIIYYPVILSQVRETFRCGLPYTKILLNNARDTPKGSTAMKEKKFAAYLIIRNYTMRGSTEALLESTSSDHGSLSNSTRSFQRRHSTQALEPKDPHPRSSHVFLAI